MSEAFPFAEHSECGYGCVIGSRTIFALFPLRVLKIPLQHVDYKTLVASEIWLSMLFLKK